MKTTALNHVIDLLKGVDEFHGRVYPYRFFGSSALQTPAAIVNYSSLEDVAAFGGKRRLKWRVRVTLIATPDVDVSELLERVIRAVGGDSRVTEVYGGTTDALRPELVVGSGIESAVGGEIVFVVD